MALAFTTTPALALTLDATALTEPGYRIVDASANQVAAGPTAAIATLALPAGAYTLQTFGGYAQFAVDATGAASVPAGQSFIEVDPSGSILVVRGITLTFDARALSEPSFHFFGATLGGWVNGGQPTTSPVTVTLLPTSGDGYTLNTLGGTASFAISGAGALSSSVCPACFTQVASTVVVNGFTWTFDGRTLTETEMVLFGANGRDAGWATPAVPTNAPASFTLFPGGSFFFMTNGSSNELRLGYDGAMTSATPYANVFVIDPVSRTITVPGYTITLSATALTGPDYALFGYNGRLAGWSSGIFATAGAAQTFTLLPGGFYSLETNGGAAQFTFDTAGAFFAQTCPACWSASGANVTVRGFDFSFSADGLTEIEIVFVGAGYHRAGYVTDWLRGCGAHTVNLLPGGYQVRTHAAVQVFNVSDAGNLYFPAPAPAWIAADASYTSFTLLGYGVTLSLAFAPPTTDVTMFGMGANPDIIGNYANGSAQCLNLVPGTYSLRQSGTGVVLGTFDVSADGSVTPTFGSGFSAGANGGLCAQTRCITNRPPDANAGATQTVNEGSVVCLAGTGTDPDGDPVSFAWSQSSGPSATLTNPASTSPCFVAPQVPDGASVPLVFQLQVCDPSGACDTSNVTVIVQDVIEPPRCAAASASATIWPPNHKLVPVSLSVPSASGMALVTVTGVTQDEPTNGLGDGDTGPADAQLLAGGGVMVRAERAGTPRVPGNGRVYSIQFTATNAGGSCTGSVTVCVPHDQGNRSTCVDDGQRYSSL